MTTAPALRRDVKRPWHCPQQWCPIPHRAQSHGWWGAHSPWQGLGGGASIPTQQSCDSMAQQSLKSLQHNRAVIPWPWDR